MTKSQMQETIDMMQATINTQAKQLSLARAEISDIQLLKKKEVADAKNKVEDEFYKMWKQMNGKFMKRYIEELIANGELNFSFNSHYGGYFDMEVSMDDTVLTTACGEICMHRNGLEE